MIFGAIVLRQPFGGQILVQQDAVLGDEDLVRREGEIGVRVGHHLDAPGVGADQRHLLLREPFRRLDADAGEDPKVRRVGQGIVGVALRKGLAQAAPDCG